MLKDPVPASSPLLETEQGFWRGSKPVQVAVLGLVVVTLFRLWFLTRIQLVPDEAYYWLWSKHLALSYRDKGPLIAWTIAVGTWLFGDTVFGIRFFAAVLSAGIGWQLFTLTRRLYDTRTALWCLGITCVIPMFAAGAILMTIDSLSVFFWAWAANVFWTALDSRKTRHWFALGLLIGCGFLSKFTNGVQLACIALFLLWSRPHRSLFFSRQTVAMVAAFCLTILPLLYWNSQVGWIHVHALSSRSGAGESFHVHPLELLVFLAQQAAVLSPLVALGVAVAAVGMVRRHHEESRVRFLICQFAPIYGIFLFFSLNKAGEANWPVPALVTGMVLLVAFWREQAAGKPRWRWAVGAALALASLMTLVLHNTDYLRLPSNWEPAHPELKAFADRLHLQLPSNWEPLHRVQGWTDFAGRVQRLRQEQQASLLIGDHYYLASMMQFYLPDRPVTYLPTAPYGTTQFTLWPGYELKPDTRALYVSYADEAIPPVLQREFKDCKLVEDFWSQHAGRPMNHFQVYLLTGAIPTAAAKKGG